MGCDFDWLCFLGLRGPRESDSELLGKEFDNAKTVVYLTSSSRCGQAMFQTLRFWRRDHNLALLGDHMIKYHVVICLSSSGQIYRSD